MIRHVGMYLLTGMSIVALAWSAWLAVAVVGAVVAGTEAGNGLFLLIYVALPSLVLLMSLARLAGLRTPWSRSGAFLTALASAVALAQVVWMLGLAPRIAWDPLLVAIVATAAVGLLTVANLRATLRRA